MAANDGGKSPNNPHSHKYTIADNEAVETLIQKLESNDMEPEKRGTLREAVLTAAEEYREAGENERKAFFHGLLTGYSVARKLHGRGSTTKAA